MKNYRPFLEEAIERKLEGQNQALDWLYSDPSVSSKMLRSIGRAQAASFSVLDDLCAKSHVSRQDIERTLARLDAEVDRRKGEHDTSDPESFGTGVYIDAMHVLREALDRGDTAGELP